MSFEQHPDEDGRGRDPQDAETTGRIYQGDDHTAQLPSHPRPENPQGTPPQYGSAGSQQAPYGGNQQSYGGAQQPSYGSGSDQQAYGAAAQHQPYGAGAPGPYATPAPQHQGTGYGAPSYTSNTPYSPADHGNRRTRRGRWAAVPLAAVLAAVLASGGTYALTQDGSGSSASSGSHTTVVQANPADFADAGTVDWSATASKVGPSVVSITVVSSSAGDQGSGVILDTSGNIVTNNHVVTGAGSDAKVTVTLNDNRTYDAKVVGTDPSTDLAVVKLLNPPNDLKPITFGDDKKLVVGQPVMAVGNPLGLSGTVTTGIVSALNRPVTTQQESQGGGNDPFGGGSQSSQDNTSTTNAIQTSAAINPGNSGGALVNGSGKLIGINSSIATLGQSSGSSQSGNIGIGFAIPVSVVKNITSQLIQTGKVKHAQLGVRVASQPTSVKVGNATEQAAKIVSVNSGSPAARAGLKAGDVVTKFNGQQVSSSDALIGYVRALNVGDKVTLTIVRGGQQQNVTVTLGEASSS